MAKYNFTADRGVQFHDGEKVIAAFKQEPGESEYRFSTDDAKAADYVRKVDGYGITEVKSEQSNSK